APGTRVHYTADGSTPNDSSSVYTKPIEVTLSEGEIKMLKAVVVNSIGRNSVVYAATIVRGTMREPDQTDAAKPGLRFSFAVPNENPELKGMSTSDSTRSTNLNQFAQRFDLKKPFAVTFDGYFR